MISFEGSRLQTGNGEHGLWLEVGLRVDLIKGRIINLHQLARFT